MVCDCFFFCAKEFPMLTPERFISIASILNPLIDQCPVLVRRQSFHNMEMGNPAFAEMNDLFFSGENEVSISRQNIFDIDAMANVDYFILSVLYWGFPTNMHGICGNVLQSYHVIRDLTFSILIQPNVTLEYYQGHIFSIIERCHGVKIAFFSKLFYFCRMSINGIPCLILDSFVYKGLGCVDDAQFAQIQQGVEGYNNSYIPYYLYNQGIHEITNRFHEQIQIRGDQIEYLLFKIAR